jgi:hypothetical protein
MHPVVLAIVALAVVAVLSFERRHALLPVLVAFVLTPFGQQLFVGGFHFYTARLIILAALVKTIPAQISKGHFKRNLTSTERAFLWWTAFRAIAYVLLWRESGALVVQIALCLDAYGGYLLFRYFFQDRGDVVRGIKMFSVVAAILACCMSYEYLSRVNLFSYINTFMIVPWLRDGRVRAQGTYGNSITAGVFGATLAPLFFWLWKFGNARLCGAAGLIASTAIVFTSRASTPASAYLAGFVVLFMWPIRNHLRLVRWSIVVAILGCALVMKAPVWYLIARVDFVGGHGWDRAYLVDQSIRHFSSWFLFGSKDNADWGPSTWDTCNQFANEALTGGTLALVLFITLLTRGFREIGRARRLAEGDRPEEWFLWSIGVALFTHVIAFFGIAYYDQTKLWWLAFLAMIYAATKKTVTSENNHSPGVPMEFADAAYHGAAVALAGTTRAEDVFSVDSADALQEFTSR